MAHLDLAVHQIDFRSKSRSHEAQGCKKLAEGSGDTLVGPRVVLSRFRFP